MEKVIIACLSCESATTREKSRSLVLALSRSRASRFFKTSIFQTRLRFKCENLAFLFSNKKARLARDREWPQRNTIIFTLTRFLCVNIVKSLMPFFD